MPLHGTCLAVGRHHWAVSWRRSVPIHSYEVPPASLDKLVVLHWTGQSGWGIRAAFQSQALLTLLPASLSDFECLSFEAQLLCHLRRLFPWLAELVGHHSEYTSPRDIDDTGFAVFGMSFLLLPLTSWEQFKCRSGTRCCYSLKVYQCQIKRRNKVGVQTVRKVKSYK